VTHHQPATRDDPHARRSDPTSSHEAVAAIARNLTLSDEILRAAKRLAPAPFDDWDLVELVEEQTGRKQQRNVIARARGLMEYESIFVRLGVRQRQADERRTLHFRLPRPGEIVIPPPAPYHPEFIEVEGWRWCTRHEAVQQQASFFCDQYARDGSSCTPKPLWIKE